MQINVFLIILQRLWQGLSGLITIFLLICYLSPLEQGWYYSFLSLAAFYTLFDLGLSVVLVQFSAHLFIDLKWFNRGYIDGEGREYFLSLVGQSLRIYSILAVLFCVLLIPAGMIFFEGKNSEILLSNNWQFPWVFLIVATGANILMLPFLALVEGSGQVGEVYGLRLLQGVLGSIACWVLLIMGGGLWAATMAPFVGFFVGFIWLAACKPKFLLNSFGSENKLIRWTHEIWPLQWRVGLSWISGYLLTQIYTPILFNFQNAVVAGQMGLSLTIANMLGLLAQSWIAHRVPQMAKAASRRDWQLLDRVFFQDFKISILSFVAGALVLIGVRYFVTDTVYDSRILSFWPFIGLLSIAFVNHVIGALAAHLRSYRKEPLVWISLLGAILTVPFSIWAAIHYSAEGVVLSMLSVQVILILPIAVILWFKCNKEWRAMNE